MDARPGVLLLDPAMRLRTVEVLRLPPPPYAAPRRMLRLTLPGREADGATGVLADAGGGTTTGGTVRVRRGDEAGTPLDACADATLALGASVAKMLLSS